MQRERKLSLEVKRYLEKELRDYTKNKEYLKELEEDIIYSSASPEPGMPGSPNRGKEQLTNKVQQLINNTEINRVKRVIRDITKVLEGLNDLEYEVYVRHFKRGQSPIKVCVESPMSERSFFRNKNKIIYKLADEMGF